MAKEESADWHVKLGTARYTKRARSSLSLFAPSMVGEDGVSMAKLVAHSLSSLKYLGYVGAVLLVAAYFVGIVPPGLHPKEMMLVVACGVILVALGLRWAVGKIENPGAASGAPVKKPQRTVEPANATAGAKSSRIRRE